MFVKNYLKLVNAINHQENIHDLHDLFQETEDYLKSNPELLKAQDNFELMILKEVADVVFSHFPEIKPKEPTLRKEFEKIIDNLASDIFSDTFDIVYNYLENPNRFDHNRKRNFGVRTDEEIQEIAMKKTKHLSGEDKEFMLKVRIQGLKVLNRKYTYPQKIHKAILRCITSVFLEIPLLPGNGLRYIDYCIAGHAYTLGDEMVKLFL